MYVGNSTAFLLFLLSCFGMESGIRSRSEALNKGLDEHGQQCCRSCKDFIHANLLDARALVFLNEFDAVFSNAVLHWIKDDPDTPIAGAFRALKAGARFVGELGGHGCVGAITVALVATLERRGIKNAASWIPWYFPTVEAYEMRLRRAGFVPRECGTDSPSHAATNRNTRLASHLRQSVLRRAAARGTRRSSR